MYFCKQHTMTTQKYKKSGNRGLFDEQDTYQKLSAIGNPLEKISLVVEFKFFRETLEKGVLNQDKKTMPVQSLMMW